MGTKSVRSSRDPKKATTNSDDDVRLFFEGSSS